MTDWDDSRIVRMPMTSERARIGFCEIVALLVQPGDWVGPQSYFVEVMTDKATVEVPSDKSGWVERILTRVGDCVPPGEPLLLLAAEGDRKPPIA